MLPGRVALVLFSVAAFAACASAAASPYPAGTIVATGTFTPVPVTPQTPIQVTTAKGKTTFIVPPTGPATLTINLTGSLDQVTMSHIHWFNPALNYPILVGLFPRYKVLNGTDVEPLNPPFSYKGSFSVVSTFPLTEFPLSLDRTSFLSYLKAGTLFVNVHTVAAPWGATMAILQCKQGC